MERLLISIFVLLLIGSVGDTAERAAEEDPSPKAVSIYVTAVSQKGQLVEVSAADLSIQEDKQAAHIERVECGKAEPLLIAVLVDTSGSRVGNPFLPVHYDALKRFLSSTLAKGDAAYIVAFSDETKSLSALTSDVSILGDALDKLKSTEARGKTAVYDSIRMASDENLSVDHVRRVIVMIGDFDDNASKINISEASAAPLRSRSTVFIVVDDDGGLPRQSPLLENRGQEYALRIARETGGQAFFVERQDQFLAALDSIHNVLNHSCRVEYTSSSTNDRKELIRLSAKVVHGHVTLFAPQARPARVNAAQP